MPHKNNLRELILSILPPIRIHTWGGYGSQLYAVYLSILLQSKFPSRRILFVAHTSGVTKRTFEIAADFDLKFVQVDDYSGKTPGTISLDTNVRMNMRKLVRRSLELSGIMSSCNSNFEIQKIKPWLLFVRGHYTHLVMDAQIVKKLYSNLSQQVNSEINTKPDLCIQYRLGDLLHISNKSFTNPSAILEVISKSRLIDDNSKILVLSDSPKKAEEFLLGVGLAKNNLCSLEMSPAKTIFQGVNSIHFIGTTSKLSLWITVLRSEISNKPSSFLPSGFEVELRAHKLRIFPTLY